MIDPPITYVTIKHIQAAQAVAGDGLPLVMLHGWGANIKLIWPLAQRLMPLGYRVYVPDLPGFGQSTPPSAAWSVHDYVDYVLAYLDYHHLERIYLFGHSFGGRLSLVLGAEHPERIIRMALADSAGVRPNTPLHLRARLAVYKSIRDILYRIGMSQIGDRLRAWYAEKYGSSDYKDASGVMRETFVKVVNEDLLPYAACVKPATFLFWGELDEDTPLWQGRLLEKTIPDAGLHIHRGAGHYSYLDNLNDTVRIMDVFFKQVE